MRQGIQASILGGGGAAGEPLMWGLERLGVPIPTPVAFIVVVISAALLLLAAMTLAHMCAVWLRAQGRGKLGQWLIICLGTVFVFIGIGAIAYALIWFQSVMATAHDVPKAGDIIGGWSAGP